MYAMTIATGSIWNITVKVAKKTTPREKKEIEFGAINCPKCKQSKLIKGKTAVGCLNYKVCDFKVPFHLMAKKLSDKQLSDLITKGKTTTIKGLLTPGSIDKVNGKFSLDEQFNVDFVEG